MFICKILLVLFLSVEAVQLFVWFGDWTESSLSFLLSRSTQSTHSYKNHAFLSNIHRRSYSMDAAESNMGFSPRISGSHTGAAWDRSTKLLISRQPALPPEQQESDEASRISCHLIYTLTITCFLLNGFLEMLMCLFSIVYWLTLPLELVTPGNSPVSDRFPPGWTDC